MTDATGAGTNEDPWQLTTPPGSSADTMGRDETTHERRNNRMRAR